MDFPLFMNEKFYSINRMEFFIKWYGTFHGISIKFKNNHRSVQEPTLGNEFEKNKEIYIYIKDKCKVLLKKRLKTKDKIIILLVS
jgi:hypothetical protein